MATGCPAVVPWGLELGMGIRSPRQGENGILALIGCGKAAFHGSIGLCEVLEPPEGE